MLDNTLKTVALSWIVLCCPSVASEQAGSRNELDLQYKGGPFSPPGRTQAAGVNRLASGIAAARRVTWFDQGIQASLEAVTDCQRGDHPGGGMGLFSIATMRPSAPSDHCRRF